MVFGPQLFDLFSVGSAPGVDDGDGDDGSEGQSSQFGDSSLGGKAAGGVASCDENVVIDTFLRLAEGSADRAVLDGRSPDGEAMSEAVSAVSHAFGSADAAAGPAEKSSDGKSAASSSAVRGSAVGGGSSPELGTSSRLASPPPVSAARGVGCCVRFWIFWW
jgi:hypothetical protein